MTGAAPFSPGWTALRAPLPLSPEFTAHTRRISDADDEYEDADGEKHAYPPGIILWQVRWEPLEGQAAETTWEAEWQVETAQAAVHEFMGSCKPHPWCKHKHHPDVCKCKLPLWHLGQDEKIWKAFQMAKATWLVRTVRALRKKTDGPGKMASGHQCELRGFGFRMSAAELRKVNAWRAARKRSPLDSSPGLQFLQYGKNKDGYWDAEMFGKQIDRLLDCFDCLHPDWQLCLEVICAKATHGRRWLDARQSLPRGTPTNLQKEHHQRWARLPTGFTATDRAQIWHNPARPPL